MMQMYLRRSDFIWLQTTTFWVTHCLVEYGFASLFLEMFVEEMFISHLHWPLVNVVDESFLFQAVVNTLVFMLVWKKCKAYSSVFAAHVQQQNHNSGGGQGSPGAPGLGSESLPCSRALGTHKKGEEKFLLQPSGLPEVGGEREEQEHSFER